MTKKAFVEYNEKAKEPLKTERNDRIRKEGPPKAGGSFFVPQSFNQTSEVGINNRIHYEESNNGRQKDVK